MKEAREFFDQGYEAYPPYYEGKHWFLPYDEQSHVSLSGGYEKGDVYPIDARAFSLLRRLQQREAPQWSANQTVGGRARRPVATRLACSSSTSFSDIRGRRQATTAMCA